MKRSLVLFTVCLIAVNILGCDAVQRKFTRKKKEQPKAPKIYQVQKYQKRPTAELYQKHYSYWASWQSEIAATLGQNHKKDVQCIEQILTNIKDMQALLVPEKAVGLDKTIKRMEMVRDIIVKESLSQYNKTYAMSTLDREGRFVKREFVYSKVKNYIRESAGDIPGAAVKDGS